MPRVAASRREAHFEARREHLMQVALRLFSAHGFDSTTVDKIAHEAGVAKGSLYLYFPTKVAVLEGLIHRYALLPDLPEIVGQIAELAPAEGIRRLVVEIWRRFKERQELARVVVREIQSHPVRSKLFSRHVAVPANCILADCLQTWMDRGLLRNIDSTAAAQSLFGMLWGFLLTQVLMGAAEFRPLSDEQITEAIADLFLNGASLRPAADGAGGK